MAVCLSKIVIFYGKIKSVIYMYKDSTDYLNHNIVE